MGVQLPSEPITRKEQYLAKAAGQAVEVPAEPITREEAYLDAIAKGGGGGGTTNYNSLSNKPQIAGTELQGNKSLADLGIASAQSVSNITNGEEINNFADVENALSAKQNALTAGLYIDINNDTISVKRDITQTAQEIVYNFTIPGDYTLRVKKYVNGDLIDTTDYQFNSVTDPINLDSIMEVSKKPGGGFYWVVKNLIASTTQAADYSVELYALQTTTNYTQNFVATIDADKKLIIQSELDTAINAIKDGQSIDSFADVETALAGKQGTLTFDDTPTDGSNNPVKSNGIYDALATKANTDMVAADFNAESSYTAGNYCVYNGKFYRFKNNHTGVWSASDVDEIKIAGELASLKSGLNDVSMAKFINPYLESGEFAVYWNNYSDAYANLDNIDVSGFGGVSDTNTNIPSDSDGWGSLVSFCCGGIRLQFYYSWNNSKLYFRSYLTNTWTAWKNITMS